MGRIRNIFIGLLILITVSCEGILDRNQVGKPIKFGIAQHTTRTAYSSNYDGRIDWNKGDKVAIYMDWDETRSGYGYYGYPREEKGIYEVYNIHENGRESHGRIRNVGGTVLKWQGNFEGNNGRANEFLHTFWSVYPSDTPFVNGEFKFSLPSNQNDINDVSGLGLAAYEKDINSAKEPNSEGYVELHYYPMFTTLCVTIDNKANFPTESGLILSSDQYGIVGSYSVDAKALYGGVSDGTGNSVSSNLRNNEATFFIIPRKYEKDKLYFSLGDKTMSIPETLYPGYKYNIKITTKVEVSGRMTDAAAQLIAGILGYGNSGQGLKDLMNQYLSGCYSDPNYFNNTVWNNFLNNIRSKLPNVTAADFDMFSDNEWECIKRLLKSLTKLEVNNGNYLNAKLTKKDFELFPNIEEIDMLYEQDVEIELNGWPKLKTVNISGNGKVILTVKNCPELTTITFSDGSRNNGSYADVDKTTCPKYN